MSNDERVNELEKGVDVKLEYSNKLGGKHVTKPDRVRLKELAQNIRKNLEESALEAPVHPHPNN